MLRNEGPGNGQKFQMIGQIGKRKELEFFFELKR